jgi:iron complex outermembrane receptor protein
VQYGQTDFNAIGEAAFVPPSEVKTGGVFVTEETGLATGTLGLGLRFDRQTAQPDSGREREHKLLNASVSYLYPVGDSQQISLIASHAERAPTAEELFSEGKHAATNSYQVGDAELDREASNNLELTWSYTGTLNLNASLYYRDFSDFIFEAADGSRFSHDLESEGLAGGDACSGAIGDFEGNQEEFDAAPPCYFFHQQGAEFTGIEAEAVVPLAEFLSLRLWGDAVRAKLANSGDVPRIPPARLGVSVGFNRDGWYAGLDASHGFEQDNPGLNENSTQDYTRLDAHLSYSIEQWLLFLKGSNLSDEEIRNATSFLRDIAPEPGRAVVIGARYSF